jgi:hypothetical protein
MPTAMLSGCLIRDQPGDAFSGPSDPWIVDDDIA